MRRILVLAPAVTVVVATPLAPSAGAVAAWDPVWQVVQDDPTLAGHACNLAVDTSAGRVHTTGSGETVTYDAADGDLLRVRPDSAGNGGATNVAVDPITGTTVVSGDRFSFDGQYAPDGTLTVAYDRAVARLWQSELPRMRLANGFGQDSIVVDGARDRVYVVGVRLDPFGQETVLTAYRLSTGEVLWSRRPGTGEALIAVHPGTGMVVLGYESAAFAATAYSSTGQRRWDVFYETPAPAHALLMGLTAVGDGIYLTATGQNLRGAEDDIETAALDLGGTLRWAVSHDGPVAGRDEAKGIAVDPVTGTVVVSGDQEYATGPGRTDFQSLLLAYAAADGSVRWLRTERPAADPPTQTTFLLFPVSVDPDRGIVYAAGSA